MIPWARGRRPPALASLGGANSYLTARDVQGRKLSFAEARLKGRTPGRLAAWPGREPKPRGAAAARPPRRRVTPPLERSARPGSRSGRCGAPAWSNKASNPASAARPATMGSPAEDARTSRGRRPWSRSWISAANRSHARSPLADSTRTMSKGAPARSARSIASRAPSPPCACARITPASASCRASAPWLASASPVTRMRMPNRSRRPGGCRTTSPRRHRA